MYKAMKVLAIIALLVTIAGAGLVLYGINTFAPVVEQAVIAATPAVQAQEIFDAALSQVRDGTFTGRVHGDVSALQAEDCTFLTYTVRLNNRGFFPAEWISLTVQPVQDEGGYDVLQLDNNAPNVLAARSQGDIAATILRVGDAQKTQRYYNVTCYVFGRQIRFDAIAQ